MQENCGKKTYAKKNHDAQFKWNNYENETEKDLDALENETLHSKTWVHFPFQR